MTTFDPSAFDHDTLIIIAAIGMFLTLFATTDILISAESWRLAAAAFIAGLVLTTVFVFAFIIKEHERIADDTSWASGKTTCSVIRVKETTAKERTYDNE